MTTSDEIIEQIVVMAHGDSDRRTQHLFRQQLQVLVALAKVEERNEMMLDMPCMNMPASRGTMH